MRKARPLGVVRVALFRADRKVKRRKWKNAHLDEMVADGSLICITKAVPMWFDEGSQEHNFAISRFIWALRELPKEIRGWLFFDTVSGSLCQELLKPKTGRTTPIATILRRALDAAIVEADQAKAIQKLFDLRKLRDELDSKGPGPLLSKQLKPVMDMETTAEGSLRMRFCSTAYGPKGRPSVLRDFDPGLSHPNPMPAGVPAYFRLELQVKDSELNELRELIAAQTHNAPVPPPGEELAAGRESTGAVFVDKKGGGFAGLSELEPCFADQDVAQYLAGLTPEERIQVAGIELLPMDEILAHVEVKRRGSPEEDTAPEEGPRPGNVLLRNGWLAVALTDFGNYVCFDFRVGAPATAQRVVYFNIDDIQARANPDWTRAQLQEHARAIAPRIGTFLQLLLREPPSPAASQLRTKLADLL